MRLTAWLKKALKIHSPSEEMHKVSDEYSFYLAGIATKIMRAIDDALDDGKEADE